MKGISYAELAAATGEQLRVVNFELDPDSAEILLKFPGFEDFSPATEVLSNIRPGTGNVDAPRCFGMKLDIAFKKFGATGCTHDKHLRVRRSPARLLNFIGTDHVYDIKIGCDDHTFWQFIHSFEDIFGNRELEITPDNFINCLIKHTETADGYELCHHEYISALKPIRDTELTATKNEQQVAASRSETD